MKLADYFIGQLRAGQPDFEEWRGRYDEVRFDGSTWFYDLPTDTNAEDFAAAGAIAFERDVTPQDVRSWDERYILDIG